MNVTHASCSRRLSAVRLVGAVRSRATQDKNKDGILTYNADPTLNEVFVGDSSIFRGYTQPRNLVTATPGLRVPEPKASHPGAVRLPWRLQGVQQHRAHSLRRAVRTATVSRIRSRRSRSRRWSVATLNHPSKTLDGFFQDGDFLKLREVSVRWSLPIACRDAHARLATPT